MVAANGWAEEAELLGSHRQARRCRRGKGFDVLRRERERAREGERMCACGGAGGMTCFFCSPLNGRKAAMTEAQS